MHRPYVGYINYGKAVGTKRLIDAHLLFNFLLIQQLCTKPEPAIAELIHNKEGVHGFAILLSRKLLIIYCPTDQHKYYIVLCNLSTSFSELEGISL